MVLIAAKLRYLRLGRSVAFRVDTNSRDRDKSLTMRKPSFQNQCASTTRNCFTSRRLAFDLGGLLLLDVVVHLELMGGLLRVAQAIIGHAEAVMGLAELRVCLDRLLVIENLPAQGSCLV